MVQAKNTHPERELMTMANVARVSQQASGEGTHFLIPWLQRAILYDVRIKPRVGVGAFGRLTRREYRSNDETYLLIGNRTSRLPPDLKTCRWFR
jgi:regulator of protease activity HflC (stomatin/prohibitin superfamily)